MKNKIRLLERRYHIPFVLILSLICCFNSFLLAQSNDTDLKSVLRCYKDFKNGLENHDAQLLVGNIDKASVEYFRDVYDYMMDSSLVDISEFDNVQLFMISNAYFSYSNRHIMQLDLEKFILSFYTELSTNVYNGRNYFLNKDKILFSGDTAEYNRAYNFIKEDMDFKFNAKDHLKKVMHRFVDTNGKIDTQACAKRDPINQIYMSFSKDVRTYLNMYDYHKSFTWEKHPKIGK